MAGKTDSPTNRNCTCHLGLRHSTGSFTSMSTQATTPLRFPRGTESRQGCSDALSPGQGYSGACVSPQLPSLCPEQTMLPAPSHPQRMAPGDVEVWACSVGTSTRSAKAAGHRQGPERHRSPGGCIPPSTSGTPALTPSSPKVKVLDEELSSPPPHLQKHPSSTPGRAGPEVDTMPDFLPREDWAWGRKWETEAQGKTGLLGTNDQMLWTAGGCEGGC